MHTSHVASAGPAPLSLQSALEEAVRRLEGRHVDIVSVQPLAEDRGSTELKQIGYGQPLLVVYRAGGADRRLVFRTMAPNWFGHDRRSDRAALALLAADTYRDLPRHVQVLDVGAVDGVGSLVSLRSAGEFYLLTTYAEGRLYADDLRRLEETREATATDIARAEALARYLVDLRREPVSGPPELYRRALRDLVGSGEGIFGIADSYPDDGSIPASRLAAIEERCVRWRWQLRTRAPRLRRVHGDFHPYNVLFRSGADFTLLDASRGSLGEPADDVAAMTINYVFGRVLHPDAWEHGLLPVWNAFWSVYLGASGDPEVLDVIAPFFAWRSLVVASPVWYPKLSGAQRAALLSFAERVLDRTAFDPGDLPGLLDA